MLKPKVLVVVPGFGSPQFGFKKKNLSNNTQILRGDSDNFEIKYLIFQYDTFLISLIENNSDVTVKQEPGVIGEFLNKYVKPEDFRDFSYILLILDDVELPKNFSLRVMEQIYRKYSFDILSPAIISSSYPYIMQGDTGIRVVNFIEFFCYFMDWENYRKYHQLIRKYNSRWMWGLDLILYKYFRMGIVDDWKAFHHIHGPNTMDKERHSEMMNILNEEKESIFHPFLPQTLCKLS